MNKFIKNIFSYLFLLLFIVFFYAKATSVIVKNKHFKNHETESNLLIIEKERSYDLMFMGISHARNFSRHKNHLRVNKTLNKHFINIAQGKGACGANEQLFYLNYFYKKENSVDTIIYILSPPLLFSETLPQASNTFVVEPFKFDFFIDYLSFDTENKYERLSSYISSKIKLRWILYKPYSLEAKVDSLTELNEEEVKKGFEFAYGKGLNKARFDQTCKTVEETIQLALKHQSKIIFIIPPALFGKWMGHDETVEFAIKMQKKYDVPFYDHAESVLEPTYYYDHHHLNTKGLIHFTKQFLKPIM